MNDEQLIQIIPSERQLAHQQLEFYAFIHFTVNTFTDKEWGDGTEDPAVFNPSGLDCRQWIRTIKKAGFTAAIITAKHHDGFCLYKTEVSELRLEDSAKKQTKTKATTAVTISQKENSML